MFFDIRSVLAGLRAMNMPNKAKWTVTWLPRRFWFNAWTPIWHGGNGPYLSCGIWIIAIYRGF